MAAQRRVETIRSKPATAQSSEPGVIEETAQVETAETELVAERLSPEADQRGEKCAAESEAGFEENPIDKWPRLEESDLAEPFVVQPRIKNVPISSNSSALKDQSWR